jgi:uncharacterized protein (UPF0332 family)
LLRYVLCRAGIIAENSKSPGKAHGVISLFDTEFVLKDIFPSQVSADLHAAFELRQIADYRVAEPLTIEKAKETYEKAVHFVHEVSNYLLPR